jgi:S-adenosylhomocysteine hydrolase
MAQKYKVADISLAAFGRKEIEIAEVSPAAPLAALHKLISRIIE